MRKPLLTLFLLEIILLCLGSGFSQLPYVSVNSHPAIAAAPALTVYALGVELGDGIH